MNVKTWHHSEVCIVINDKSQGSRAFSCDELLYYTFIIQSAVKEFLKSVNIWRSYGHEYSVSFFLTHSVFIVSHTNARVIGTVLA